MTKLKIYTASKLAHAEMWKALSQDWPEFEFTARWCKFHVGRVPDDESFAKFFWQEDVEDVQRADVVLVYARGDDVLRGALVKAGLGIAFGKSIVAVVLNDNPSWGTWSFHPSVYRVGSMEHAKTMLDMMANAKDTAQCP